MKMPTKRVCQRGVDGSPGCGHEFQYFFEHPDEQASGCMWEDERGRQCGHRCEFTPDNLLTHEEADLVIGAIPLQALPLEAGTHEESDPHPGYDCGGTCVMHSPLTRPFRSAPVHGEVVSEPDSDSCYAAGDECAKYCGSPKAMHCSVLGDAAFWGSIGGQDHLVKCLRDDHFIHHKFVAAPPAESVESPARLFVQKHRGGTISAYELDPREVHDNGKPVYEYCPIAPIREAVEKCEVAAFSVNEVLVCKADWDRLVVLIKGEGSEMKDAMLCGPCNVGNHQDHNDDGCANDNSFNADCECPVRSLDVSGLMELAIRPFSTLPPRSRDNYGPRGSKKR